MRSVVALALLLCFVCTCLPASVEAKVENIPDDTYLFLKGVAIGLELEIGNFNACVADVNITLSDFDTGFSLIDQGIKKLSVSTVEQGIKDFGAGIEEVATAFEGCGVDTIVQDIKVIAQELQSGASGILDVIIHEVLQILHHEQDITAAFKQTIADWQAKDWQGSGEGVGEILGILLQED